MAIPFALITALAQFAPTLFKYIGVGTDSVPSRIADKAAELAQSVTGTDTVEEALAVLTGNTQKAWEYKLQVMAHEKELNQIYLTDMQSARNRDAEFVKSGTINWRAHSMYVMAWLIVVIIFVMIWSSPDLPEFVKGTSTLVLGRFLGYLDQIYQFEFGSTRSNKDKDHAIMNLTEKK